VKRACKVFAAVLALAMVLSFAGCSNNGTITMATNAGFKPLEYRKGDKIVGIDADMAAEIAKDMGKELEIVDMDFNAVVESISSGKYDLGIAGLSKTPDREKAVDFSEPYFESQQMILVKSDNTTITNGDSLKGKKIAVQEGTLGQTIVEELDGVNSKDIQRYRNYVDAVEALKSNKADAIVMDKYPAESFVNVNNGQLKMLDEVMATDVYCVAVKKGNTELLEQVNKTIKRIQEDGTLEKIIKNYID
jgi:ABC-type amino acid transport substrate-binding protein